MPIETGTTPRRSLTMMADQQPAMMALQRALRYGCARTYFVSCRCFLVPRVLLAHRLTLPRRGSAEVPLALVPIRLPALPLLRLRRGFTFGSTLATDNLTQYPPGLSHDSLRPGHVLLIPSLAVVLKLGSRELIVVGWFIARCCGSRHVLTIPPQTRPMKCRFGTGQAAAQLGWLRRNLYGDRVSTNSPLRMALMAAVASVVVLTAGFWLGRDEASPLRDCGTHGPAGPNPCLYRCVHSTPLGAPSEVEDARCVYDPSGEIVATTTTAPGTPQPPEATPPAPVATR